MPNGWSRHDRRLGLRAFSVPRHENIASARILVLAADRRRNYSDAGSKINPFGATISSVACQGSILSSCVVDMRAARFGSWGSGPDSIPIIEGLILEIQGAIGLKLEILDDVRVAQIQGEAEAGRITRGFDGGVNQGLWRIFRRSG